MSRKILKKAISSVLAILLAFELIPVQAYAAVTPEESTEPEMTVSAYDISEGDFSNEKIIADDPELTEEIADRRDKFQKEFMMENGMFLAAVYPMAVHYENNGEWDEIDNTLKLTDTEQGKAYRNTAGMWDVYLPAKLDGTNSITTVHNGYELSFSLTGELIGESKEKNIEEPIGSAETEEIKEVEISEPEQEAEPLPESEELTEEEQTGEETAGLSEETTEDAEVTEPAETDIAEPEETQSEEATDATAVIDGETSEEPVPEEAAGTETPDYDLIPAKASKAIVKEINSKEFIGEESLLKDVLKKISSTLIYNKVFDNTDLKYELISNQLKETIVINGYREGLSGYQYQIKAEGLTLEKKEDGEIIAYAESQDDPAFYLPRPFLYDGMNEISYDIKTEIEETDGGYILTYILPREWLKEEGRVYPVSMDPVVQPESDTYTIRDQSVSEFHNLSYTWGCVETGYFPPSSGGGGRQRIFTKFQNIPSLCSADVVVSAAFTMYQCDTREAQIIEAHKVNGTWDSSTITWSNMPATGTLIEDYVKTQNEGWYTWDITNIAQEWYRTNQNTGVMFKMPDAVETGGVKRFTQFYSSDYSPLAAPILTIAYVNNTGVEDTWDYVSQSAGRAGTGYVNTYTGNLVWVHDGLGFPGTRMPVSIQHIYNSNDNTADRFGMGYGWRTNYNQLVYKWGVDSSYYVWEDADGTRQFFKYKSNGLYESELDSKLKLTDTGSGDAKFCITDGKGNKSWFDSLGRLRKISNNQQTVSNILVTYSGNTRYILYVTDGAGRVYRFEYNGAALKLIEFRGTGSTQHDILYYSQTNGELLNIKYKDNKRVYFTYAANHLLSSAKDIDTSGINYTYGQTAAGVPNKVTHIEQKGMNDVIAGYIDLTYTRNQTKLTDNLGHTRTLQFNNWGSTTCDQNEQGQAVASRYVNDTSGTADSRKTGSQVALNSKLQNTVVNHVLNGNFEAGYASWVKSIGSDGEGERDYSTTEHYLGAKSLKVTQVGTTSKEFFIQNQSNSWHYARPGEVYTLSAYVKIKQDEIGTNGTGAYISLGLSEDGEKTESEHITEATNGWVKLEVTYVYPEDRPAGYIMTFLHMGSIGTAYFDCVQLERSATAGRYNLIDNGDFRFPLNTSGDPHYWTRGGSGTSTVDRRIALASSESPAPCLNDKVIQMTGSPTLVKTYYQDVPVSGNAGDVYTFAGWAKADSVPLRDNRSYTIILRFNNTYGTQTDQVAKFTTAVGRGYDWQYAASRTVASKNYTSIRVLLCYSYNANSVLFDGIQLFKEEFGHSYVYDSDGNVVSAKDLHEKTTTYEYANNDLTKITLAPNVEQTYTYDSYHNVKTATTPEGIYTTFDYDQYGNNTAVQVGPGRHRIRIFATYSTDGNQLASITNPEEETTYYTYYPQTGILESVKEPGEDESTKTRYTYNDIYQLTSVSQENPFTVGYTYNANDLLSAITTPSGNEYDYSYNSLYQPIQINVTGSDSSTVNTLISNTYDPTTYYLSTSTFGNGNTVSYSYDSFGRTASASYEDGDQISYEYSSMGELGLVKYGDLEKRFFYDFQGELRGVDTAFGTDESSVRWIYDDKNNITKETETVNGTKYITDYVYDKDNRVSSSSQGTVKTEYAYNEFNAIKEIKEKSVNSENNSETVVVDTDISFYEPSSTRSTYKAATWKNQYGNTSRTYNYTYDNRGNITQITDGTYTFTYVYDNKDRLIREDDPETNKTVKYTYDAGGNITKKEEFAYTTGNTGAAANTKNYSYGDASWPDKLTSYGGNSLSYDGMGNLTGYDGWTYTWEHGSQLAGMSRVGTIASFSYDHNGRRISKTVNGTVTKYYYSGDRLSGMKVGNDTLHFTYDALGPASVTYNGTVYYYLRNAQEDITGIVDSNGSLVVSYSYDAWGKTTNPTGSNIASLNPFRYRGYIYDSETSLYYLNSRYYSPELGRFISLDSLDVPTVSPKNANWDKNLYAYCDNNPVSRKDEGGECWHLLVGAAVGVAIQFASDVGYNMSQGESFIDALHTSSSLADYGASALSGALAASGIGFAGSVLGNAGISGLNYLLNCEIDKKTANFVDLLVSTAIGGAAGAIGGKGANGAKLRGVYSNAKDKLTRAVSTRKIAQYTAQKTTVKKAVAKAVARNVFAGSVSIFLNKGAAKVVGYFK